MAGGFPFEGPYVVYGRVEINGTVQANATVTITNVTRGGSDTCTTDSSGNYIYDDLAQLPNGYQAGDTIKVSVAGVEKTFTAASTPEEKQVDLIVAYNTITAKYDIFSTANTLSKDLTLLYDIFVTNTINKDLNLKYDLFNTVYTTITAKYDIFGNIQKELILKYDILGQASLTKYLSLRYTIHGLYTLNKDFRIRYSIDTKDSVMNMIERLTTPYNKETTSNNYKLLSIAGDECEEVRLTLTDIKNIHFVDFAYGKNLDYIGSLLQTTRQSNETDSHYRTRLKTMWQRYIGSGTIQDIKNICSAMLNVSTDRIIIIEDFATLYAHFDVWLWQQDLDKAGITANDFRTLLNVVKPAGVSISIYKKGSFECRTASDPNDATKGYNDLANSNPNAGTYASLL